MPKVWNLGNTTIRNPNRIELGLRLFAEEFQGNVHGLKAEERFAKRLIEEEIVDSSGSESEWLARKWRSVFVKLGFATDQKYVLVNETILINEMAKKMSDLGLEGLEYELTPVGQNLLDADSTGAVQDVFFRQLVCHEIPSPIPTESNFSGGRMKPFIFLLQVLNELRKQSEEGVNNVEIAAFLQLFIDHTEDTVKQTVTQILEFREKRNLIYGQTAKKEFDHNKLQESASLGGVRPGTLQDYADTTFRYSKMTGMVAQSGSRLILRENKISIIAELLLIEPKFSAFEDPIKYLINFYTGISLPTDNSTFANEEIKRLVIELQKYDKEPSINITNLSESTGIQELERVRYSILDELSWTKEEQFAIDQAKDETLQEILDYIIALETPAKSRRFGIIDRPAYLEWAIWRAFLAIDHIISPIHETRRFPVDEDLLPRHTAPGGGSDLIFEFEDYILAVEVTLTTSSRQAAVEGEPVRRHVAEAKMKYSNKDVYGIFIAPTIDNNSAETFRFGIWYQGDQDYYVNIVPFTLNQFHQIIEIFQKNRYTPKNIQKLMDRCLTYRNAKAPEWKQMISEEINRWIDQYNQ